ncbi:MAG: GNAT family N-acetyltransferase [Pirellulales bacterium]
MSTSWELLTPRLRMRPYQIDDAVTMFGVFGDPEVMRFSQSGADPNVAATQVRVQKLVDHQQRFGFSLWVVEDRATGEILGDCGLKQLADGPEIEVGYRFARAHWGRGYATEGAAASVDYGFRTLGLSRITAVVEPTNLASCKVIEKIGLRFERLAHYYGREMNYYGAERDEYLASRSS